jgi:putative peptidoglycan lipid II flippase
MSDRLEANTRTVATLTGISRLTGLARTASLSHFFGTSPLMSAFFFAFMIPNLFRRLFGEGALAAALIPIYSQLDRDDPAAARQLASLTMGVVLTVLGVVVVIAECLLFLISASVDHSNITLWLTMVMLPYMPLICGVAILGAILHVHGRFGPTAAAPIVLNLIMLAAVWGMGLMDTASFQEPDLLHIGVVAASVVAAGVVQILWSALALRQRRIWTWQCGSAKTSLKRVLTQAGPMIVGLGVLQVNTLIDGLIASWPNVIGPTVAGWAYPLAEDAMARLSFAQRLYQLPLGIFGLAVATAIFPILAKQTRDTLAFESTLRRGIRSVIFIGLPASAGLIALAEPSVRVLLQTGVFSQADTSAVSFVLLGYAPAIWAYGLNHVLARAFYARGDARTPMRIAIWIVGLNLLINVVIIWTPLREAGLAWSTSLCAVIQSAWLIAALNRQGTVAIDATVGRSLIKVGVLTAVMAGAVATAAGLFWSPADTWMTTLVVLVGLIVLGVGIIVAGSVAMKMPELKWALGRS